MIKLTKKATELLDAVTSVPYSRKGRRGLDAVLPFTCYSYWFCYFDQRGKLMKALHSIAMFGPALQLLCVDYYDERVSAMENPLLDNSDQHRHDHKPALEFLSGW
jgi:hypothetical protein